MVCMELKRGISSTNLNLTEWPDRDVFSDGLPVIEMHPVGRNNPCGTKDQARDASGRPKYPCYEVTIVKRRLQEIFVSGKPHLYFSDSVWKEL